MAAQIKVLTPLTLNGSHPVMGEDGRQVYTESILMVSARKALEKRNEQLPPHLKVKIEDYTPEAKKPAPKPTAVTT